MRVTANQVTFSRLVLLPFLCAMIYGDEVVRIAAVFVGTLVGATDTLDGYLARKQGPTVLGGMMDPIADKVFIAVGFLPCADLGWAPWWLIAALFLREFLVTTLRSSFELRRLEMRTTYLAKMKTWVQMAGLGVFLLALAIPSRTVMLAFLITTFVGPLAAWVGWRLVTGRAWKGALIGAGWTALGLALYVLGGQRVLVLGVLVAVVGITWVSGLHYLAAGARELRRSGARAFDAVRLLGAVTLPLAAIGALVLSPAPTWVVIALVSIELAHLGLDNLLAHHQAAAPAWAWGGRVLGASAFLGATLLVPAHAGVASLVALAVSVSGTTAAFVTGRRFYLEVKLREKKQAAPRASSTA